MWWVAPPLLKYQIEDEALIICQSCLAYMLVANSLMLLLKKFGFESSCYIFLYIP